MKLSPIDDIKNWWKFWSLRIGFLGTILLTLVYVWPEGLYELWELLPWELKSYVPESYASILGIVLYVIGMISRLIKQTKLDKYNEK